MSLARSVLAKIMDSQDGQAASFTVEETEFIAFSIINETGLQAVPT